MNKQAKVSQVVGASVVSVLKRQLLEANRRLAAVLRQKENLSGTCQSRGEYIEELTSQADALQSQNALYESALCEKDSQYRQAQETIRQLQHQSRQAPKPDASVLNAQEVISRFREGFVFERNRTRCAGQGAARVEGEPESAQDQGNEPAGGKVKSLQYQLAILGGTGPEQA